MCILVAEREKIFHSCTLFNSLCLLLNFCLETHLSLLSFSLIHTEAAMADVTRQPNEGCGHLAREGANGDNCHTLQSVCLSCGGYVICPSSRLVSVSFFLSFLAVCSKCSMHVFPCVICVSICVGMHVCLCAKL